jgi:hypothetical protein
MEIKKQEKSKPNFKDVYKGSKDSGIKFILEDKNGNRTEIKR